MYLPKAGSNLVFLIYFAVFFKTEVAEDRQVFTKCGGILEAEKGVIQSPNFPNEFPTPISCEWLIRAPPEKKIIIYFTQFYLKNSFYVTEYDFYQDKTTYIGPRDLGRISWKLDIPTLVAYKPYVHIEFSTENISNIHLRVIEYLLDVYGFNITYEMVDRSSDEPKNTCSVHSCSYLGNCLVNSNFSRYQCHCFEGFFGDECQYGPYCNPDVGINQCSNGGKCRYFFGSLINQCVCPPGFYGAYCEIPMSVEETDHECLSMQCSQSCKRDTQGRPLCLCFDGYKIDVDNKTCIPIARYRIEVQLRLAHVVNMSNVELERNLNQVEQDIIITVEENGIPTISKFGIIGIWNSSTEAVLEFYFYCLVSDLDNISTALNSLLSLGQVGPFLLSQKMPKYEKSQELQLIEVSNYDGKPAVQGKLLTLVCSAKGSKNIEFNWYKDNHPVVTNLTQRSIWETRVPDNVQDTQLSVLNIDNVSPYDKGRFTCEVLDFGEYQEGSINVEIITLPLVELDPMSASIPQGQPISIKCLSPDDSWGKFTYEWFKNGTLVEPLSKTEYAEDLYPTGVRFVIPNPVGHTVYTCRVTNEAGSVNVSSHIYAVGDNETSLFCPKEYYGQVTWTKTAGGHFDLQRCPTETGDFSLYGPVDVGYAKRNCKCDSLTGTCSWSHPNFSKCQSLILVKIYDKLELLRLGYQHSTVKAVFDDLHEFILHPKHHLYSGDIDVAAGILQTLLQHVKSFPSLATQTDIISAKKIVELMSAMIDKATAATNEEKQHLLVGPNMINIADTLLHGAGKYFLYSPGDFIEFSSVDLTVKQLPIKWMDELSKISNIGPVKRQEEYLNRDTEELMTAIQLHSQGLSELLLRRMETTGQNRFSPNVSVVSDMYSISTFNISLNRTDLINVSLQLPHIPKIPKNSLNETRCLSWDFIRGSMLSGGWSDSHCRVVLQDEMYTVCTCTIPGHFIVVSVPVNNTVSEDITAIEIDMVLLIGYSIALSIILLALTLNLTVHWLIIRDFHDFHLNIIICLLISVMMSLICIVKVMNQTVLSVGRIVLHYTNLVVFSFLLVEATYTYGLICNKKSCQNKCWKFIACGWGLPFPVTLVVIVVSALTGFSNISGKTLWLVSKEWFFFSFTIPMMILVLGYIIMVGLCIATLRKWKGEWRSADRQNYKVNLVQSTIILVLQGISLSVTVDINSSEKHGQIIAVVLCNITLALTVLFIWCLAVKQIRNTLSALFSRLVVQDVQRVRWNSSFRTFIKPCERSRSSAKSDEEYNVSKYYDEVNRKKYTLERRRQLSSLLGSSSTGDTKSTTVNDSSKGSDCSNFRDTNSEKAGTDSGIFDYQESERSSNTCAVVCVSPERQDIEKTEISVEKVENYLESQVMNKPRKNVFPRKYPTQVKLKHPDKAKSVLLIASEPNDTFSVHQNEPRPQFCVCQKCALQTSCNYNPPVLSRRSLVGTKGLIQKSNNRNVTLYASNELGDSCNEYAILIHSSSQPLNCL
ncbi:hypothetical protein ACJMK2_041834 [Sinanodonta woodiana]|uniref:Uncharacterized protein n=1 Tax=Sinanodonta woodiana TaxID=1069815 RepID=A0ABD3W5G2_SINWO